MSTAPIRLQLRRGGGKVAMRPVASTATVEAIAEMNSIVADANEILAQVQELYAAMLEIGGGGGGGGSVEVWAWDGTQYVKVVGVAKIFTEGGIDDVPPGMGEHDIWFRMVAPPS